ncbi:ferredoxin III, nif-specific [Consotaella salsifontis]|uniref:ferredoxin III, nif-specific n=1 Tax=Consotaella salsifontis TaxID=1365950 RepID=UPI00099ABC24|nr:ferredoxin III, nif-specific [Consotaella salsifontis]
MTAYTRDGTTYLPKYLIAIDPAQCIGCGRCFKVCGQGVMTLKGVDEDGQFINIEDEDDDEVERRVMTLARAGACIGCGACARVCTRGCQSHAAAD